MHYASAVGAALINLAMIASASAQALPQNLVYLDRDKDGSITLAEWTSSKPGTFKKMDADKDKFVTRDEAAGFYSAMAGADQAMTEKRVSWIMRADTNGDGKVTLEELTNDSVNDFKKRDKNADDVVNASDF